MQNAARHTRNQKESRHDQRQPITNPTIRLSFRYFRDFWEFWDFWDFWDFWESPTMERGLSAPCFPSSSFPFRAFPCISVVKTLPQSFSQRKGPDAPAPPPVLVCCCARD